MTTKLPPLPVGVAPGSGYWNDWYEKLRKIINDLIGGVGHNTLAGLQGGSAGQYYHLTSAEYTSLTSTNPWNYVKLTSDLVVSSTSAINTNLAFIPAANTLYEVEGQLWLQSTDVTVGPQPGVAWNTGNSDGVAHIETTASGTTSVMVNLPSGTAGEANATTFPAINTSYPAQVTASFKTGATPSGSFTITLARS